MESFTLVIGEGPTEYFEREKYYIMAPAINLRFNQKEILMEIFYFIVLPFILMQIFVPNFIHVEVLKEMIA